MEQALRFVCDDQLEESDESTYFSSCCQFLHESILFFHLSPSEGVGGLIVVKLYAGFQYNILIYLVQPAANLAPIRSRKPPPSAAGIGTPFVVANVSDEVADRNPPNMAAIT